ncbi:MAG: hypothetical protein WBM75_19470, partial [Polyangiales bacterium]
SGGARAAQRRDSSQRWQLMPSVGHIIYIPGILLIGFALGFRIGAKAVRAELERREQERRR